MSGWLVVILLPIAAWSGWWVGMRKEARDLRLSKSREAYFEGLSFLLDDQTDQAVDVFLSMAELDKQTFDNQLTLGALFRKRGELDRALHLHRQLADNEQLDEQQSHAIHYELAEDYAKAGMYDQALDGYAQLVEGNYRRKEVLAARLRILEITENWHEAIKTSENWQKSGYGNKGMEIAQYYCEIARIFMQKESFEAVKHNLDCSLENDHKCGRAYWMLGLLAEAKGEFVTAIHSYQSVSEQAIPFIPDILEKLAFAYRKIDRLDEYEQWLVKIEAKYPSARLTLATAKYFCDSDKNAQAKDLIEKRVKEFKNPLLLSKYLSFSDDEIIQRLFEQVGQSIAPKTTYQCNECGFRQQRIIWHCPSCHAWSSFRPLLELKIEQR